SARAAGGAELRGPQAIQARLQSPASQSYKWRLLASLPADRCWRGLGHARRSGVALRLRIAALARPDEGAQPMLVARGAGGQIVQAKCANISGQPPGEVGRASDVVGGLAEANAVAMPQRNPLAIVAETERLRRRAVQQRADAIGAMRPQDQRGD